MFAYYVTKLCPVFSFSWAEIEDTLFIFEMILLVVSKGIILTTECRNVEPLNPI